MSDWMGIDYDFLFRRSQQFSPLSECLDAMADLERSKLGWLVERMNDGRVQDVQSYGAKLPSNIDGPPWPIIVHRALGPHSTQNLSWGGSDGLGFPAFSSGERTHVYTITTDVIVGRYDAENIGYLSGLTADLVEIFDRLYCANTYLQGRCNSCMLTSGHTVDRIYYGGEWWWAQRLMMQLSVDYAMRGPDLTWQSANTSG